MAATPNVHQFQLSANSGVPRPGVLTLYGYGIRVNVERGHLLIEDGIGADRRRFRLPRVGHGLKRLVIIGSDGVVSLAGLRWLADQDVGFTMLERNGKVLAVTGPVRPSDAKLRRAQGLAHTSGAALRIARELVNQKLTAQEQVARQKLFDSKAADTITGFRGDLPTADSISSVRLIEAQAALAYWSAWSDLPINFPKNDLHRGVPDHWQRFGARISPLTRSPRLAVNPANAMLSYLYALLESEARLAAAALGLDPGLGVLHVDTGNRDSLALDILEPARACVDSYVLDWITRQPLKREWFFEERNGNCRLMGPFAKQLAETAPSWGRAVAPVAEWVAQALWRSTAKSKNKGSVVPTRLTQRRRREGRGHAFTVRENPAPCQLKICEVCGAEGVKNRYCRSCAVEASRQNMAQVALIGHMKPKSKRAKERTCKAISHHAVANTWWDPSNLPEWLTEECYVQRIQPLLKTKKVREIAQAISVSQPYAAFVRCGRRRPHPRHWEKLAGLVEITRKESNLQPTD